MIYIRRKAGREKNLFKCIFFIHFLSKQFQNEVSLKLINDLRISMMIIFLFFCVNIAASQQPPIDSITLENVEYFINNVIKKNSTLLELLNPSIHTKKGLEKIIDCLKKELTSDSYIECTHPAIVKPDDDLSCWVELKTSVKYPSYDEKIMQMSVPLYHIKQNQKSNIKNELETYYKQTVLFYFYLSRYVKNGNI